MVEIVASISTQMLHDFGRQENVSYRVIQITDQVMGLVSVLRRIEYLLKNAHNSERVVNHVETIRCLAYRIEDVLETCAVKVAFVYLHKYDERCIKRVIRRYFGELNAGVALKSIRDMISDVEPGIKSFREVFPDDDVGSIRNGEEPRVGDRSLRWPRQIYPRGNEEHFVGMEDELKQLISLVVEDQKHRVVCIWGVEALGKTTITRKVYNDPEVRRCFKAFAWVSVSHECEIGVVLQNILRQLGPGKVREIAEEEQNMNNQVKEKTEEQNVIDQVKEIKEEEQNMIDQVKEIIEGEQNVIDQVKEIKREEQNMIDQVKKIIEGEQNVIDQVKEIKEGEKNVIDQVKEIKVGEQNVIDQVKEIKVGEENVIDQVKEITEVEQNAIDQKKIKEEERNMIDQVKEIQRQKSCLIVLDSIWEINQWEHISSALEMESTKTRVLLTTREKSIADVGFPFKLRLLNEDEGWELLKKHAFPGKKAPDFGMLPKLGKEMVRKCGYLPLAISCLGRNLSSKISVSEWQMVSNDVTRYLQRDYQTEADGRLCDMLSSRCDHLPYYLKQCFLYLGIFREDEDIDSDDLIFLWMAEGMVSSEEKKNEETIMDTAEEEEKETTIMRTAEAYLRELAFSGLLQVQVDELSATRRFKLFCLHNRARELSLYQGEKEDFRLKVVDFCDGKQPTSDPFTLSDGTRRLVIHFNKQVNFCEHNLVATDHLRSLLFLNSDQKYVDIPVRISDFVKFKLLRVLHFVRCKFEGRKLPKGIDKLVNLRYLGLLYCDLDELPPSIGSLRNLHVLNIRAYGSAQITIPNVIFQMIRLKHLRLPDYSDREQTNKLILHTLLEMETLVGFNSQIHDVSSLSNLKKLRHLVTHAYSNDGLTSIIRFIMFYGARVQTDLIIENKCDFSSSEGFAILEEVLMCPNLHALTLSMVLIYKFPDCGMHLSSDIAQLKLIGCKLKEDPMEALGKFVNLRKLCLGYGAFVGRQMAIHDGGFRNLEYLEFRSLPYLEEWMVDDRAMCNLSALIVRRCPKLEKIPDGLTSISSLKNLEIELAPRALPEGREAEYRLKFAFVNSFIIRTIKCCRNV